ncbi:O-antigen ligase like membrane protein [Myroides sp. A21]|uniref:O-antigen ligase family protein n=1 Tax=Myroides sp. A21 TaxID=1583100 RepID=UPI00057D480E|nr:O-antigen ligase family protein [Myroides sp. A21]AJA68275.1 O-antigen ligase like membrane protein [Myroides sp. A21]
MKLIHDNVKKLDFIIGYLLFPLLILDMINGILHENKIEFIFSLSQLYKSILILLLSVRLILYPKVFQKILLYTLILFIPSITQFCFYNSDLNLLFQDTIRTSKYLIIIISFYYFKYYLVDNNSFTILWRWIKFSFWILASNLLSKLVGLGYPMYEFGNIGTRGYFIAGNEISALLIVLSAIIGYYYLVVKKDKLAFIFYGAFSFVLGLLISSKTGMLGIVLVYIAILLSVYDFSKNISKATIGKALLGISSILIIIVLFITNTSIFDRYTLFWDKLDFVTFVLSSRNLYFHETWLIIQEKYNLVNYFIGVGPTQYYEWASKFVEIDMIDIFFSYGIMGVLLFFQFYGSLLKESILLSKKQEFPFGRVTLILLCFLLLLSCLSGHILNSGIAGVYIGFGFAIMFKKI